MGIDRIMAANLEPVSSNAHGLSHGTHKAQACAWTLHVERCKGAAPVALLCGQGASAARPRPHRARRRWCVRSNSALLWHKPRCAVGRAPPPLCTSDQRALLLTALLHLRARFGPLIGQTRARARLHVSHVDTVSPGPDQSGAPADATQRTALAERAARGGTRSRQKSEAVQTTHCLLCRKTDCSNVSAWPARPSRGACHRDAPDRRAWLLD